MTSFLLIGLFPGLLPFKGGNPSCDAGRAVLIDTFCDTTAGMACRTTIRPPIFSCPRKNARDSGQFACVLS